MLNNAFELGAQYDCFYGIKEHLEHEYHDVKTNITICSK